MSGANKEQLLACGLIKKPTTALILKLLSENCLKLTFMQSRLNVKLGNDFIALKT